ncbi:tRNA modification GTPase [Calycomorphotria hydatis]|uniref:tRNA modification GTPase MnmE n=1 Tax=Calycomorphotria hydatis TaxID=2528027 RepID=A0A517T3B6_9PLAN|nr:tRNA modification GTPase [Calycomorphotria hydatis]QDT62859.1 tRNA modification GTPase MnmE [Calycomorphotria hydatis]
MTPTLPQLDETIAALASAPGPSPRGILRISGPETVKVLAACFQPLSDTPLEQYRRATRIAGRYMLADALPLEAQVYLWPNSRSYTGQPAAEVHMIGSPPLLEAVLSQLNQHGARPARPGEFTLRAFLAGRMDLAQAEAVLGVIDADDHAELELALSQLAGGLSGRLAKVRSRCLDLLAEIEAGLDFVEEDIEFVSQTQITEVLTNTEQELSLLLDDASNRMTSSTRPVVVLAGLPNAGKSSLFNAFTTRNQALVSSQAGTTRDYLSADVDINGQSIELIDTAGWEKRDDEISVAAQQLREEQLARADLVLWCTPADATPEERIADQTAKQLVNSTRTAIKTIRTKADLNNSQGSDEIKVSILNNDGTSALRNWLSDFFTNEEQSEHYLLGSTASRAKDALTHAVASNRRALEAVQVQAGDEIVAAELRDMLHQLATILGEVYTDDILDIVFGKFCIGK